MPDSIPITVDCCDDTPSSQPSSDERVWCKLTIFFDPADQTCSECKFSTGAPDGSEVIRAYASMHHHTVEGWLKEAAKKAEEARKTD